MIQGKCIRAYAKRLSAPPKALQEDVKAKAFINAPAKVNLDVADLCDPRLRYHFCEAQARLSVVSSTFRLFRSGIAQVGRDAGCRVGSFRPVLYTVKNT